LNPAEVTENEEVNASSFFFSIPYSIPFIASYSIRTSTRNIVKR